MFRTAFLQFLLFSCLAILGGCLDPLISQPVPAIPEAVLASAGDNRQELEFFLARFGSDPDLATAARFLVANLPLCDRVAMDADLLAEHLVLAHVARNEQPWGRDYSEEIFFHYVLAHRISQEPAQAWRSRLSADLAPIVQGRESMAEAAMAVNQWLATQVEYRSSSAWDQGPLTTLRRGYGRCEETTILLVAALRSVGIPARQAIVPAWQHTHDNHTWAEAWINGRWRYLEAADPSASLDSAWFTSSLRAAPLVLAVVYGNPRSPLDPVYRTGEGYSLLNVTRRYAPTRTLAVEVRDGQGLPMAGGKVYASVFNYGLLRPVASLDLDEQGQARMTIGPGTFMLTAQDETGAALGMSSRLEGEPQTEPTVLHISREGIGPTEVTLRFPEPDPEWAVQEVPMYLEQPADPPRHEDLVALSESGARSLVLDNALSRFLTLARGNSPEILTAWMEAGAVGQPYLAELLAAMDPKDLATTTSSQLLAESQALAFNRDVVALDEVDPDIYNEYLASSRIHWEPYSAWRHALAPVVAPMFARGREEGLSELAGFVAAMGQAQRRDLGHMLTPGQVLAAGVSPTPDEAAIFAVSSLRAAGIPARFLRDADWVEYYSHDIWLPLVLDAPVRVGDPMATPEVAAWYGEPATVQLQVTRRGTHLLEAELRYFRDFTICRLQEGKFVPLYETVDGEWLSDNTLGLTLPPGEYFFIVGGPANQGERQVVIHPFEVLPGPNGLLSIALDR
ncbi:MAG: transglutaminase domain-containing protein [Desulfovibrio sp.]|nr:MAG: transglutaminase domain-containing protein [Desulfovibrio sp.]